VSSLGCGAANVAVAWPCDCAVAQLVLLSCSVLLRCDAASVAVAWPRNCAVAQLVLLSCSVLLCCGAAGVADARAARRTFVGESWRQSEDLLRCSRACCGRRVAQPARLRG
jgi:hypothetical protein